VDDVDAVESKVLERDAHRLRHRGRARVLELEAEAALLADHEQVELGLP